MYAIIETGGKQVKVEVGDKIYVEKLNVEAGQDVSIDKVLFVGGESTKVGAPYVEGAKVVGEVTEQGKHKKVVVVHYKPKKNIRKKNGHRQAFTQVKIEKINA